MQSVPISEAHKPGQSPLVQNTICEFAIIYHELRWLPPVARY